MAKKLSVFGKYLATNELTVDEVAEKLGVTKSYVHALASGTMTPGLKLAVEIQKWSRGAVMPESWLK